MSRYEGKVALVTGGGSGLGEAFCHRLAREGAKVAILDIDCAGGERVASDIRASGAAAVFIEADVQDDGAMQRAVRDVVAAFGRLDVAVNNAGIGGGIHPIPDFPVADWTRTIMINLVGTFISMRAEIPALVAVGGGSIVNIASMVAVVAHPFSSAYVASKHGVIGLTKSAALEWGPKNIRVNAVGPTYVDTPLTREIFQTEEDWANCAADHPLGRCATPEDIAALVAFLGSDEARVITGSLYLADAGYTAR